MTKANTLSFNSGKYKEKFPLTLTRQDKIHKSFPLYLQDSVESAFPLQVRYHIYLPKFGVLYIQEAIFHRVLHRSQIQANNPVKCATETVKMMSSCGCPRDESVSMIVQATSSAC
uniref:Uncharacterized protein n=1 Tax=Micrurus corallinus TaxID=54390 RepID=A0A2D4FQ69_MICCO